MDNMKILLMYAGAIDMKGSDGDAIKGVSAEYYFFGEKGEMLESKISADDVSGIRRGKCFMDFEVAKKVSYVPGIYDGTFEMSVGGDGKPVLKLVDINFINKASITEVLPSGSSK